MPSPTPEARRCPDTVEVADGAGVALIVAGIVVATVVFVVHLQGDWSRGDAYRGYRQGIGKAILLGLELLVAADIIRTVAVSPTFKSAGVLALIVLIRTFLSMSLDSWRAASRGSSAPVRPASRASRPPSRRAPSAPTGLDNIGRAALGA